MNKKSSPVFVVALDKTRLVVSFWAPIGHSLRWPCWRTLVILIGPFPILIEFLWPSVDVGCVGVLVTEVFLVDGLIIARVFGWRCPIVFWWRCPVVFVWCGVVGAVDWTPA